MNRKSKKKAKKENPQCHCPGYLVDDSHKETKKDVVFVKVKETPHDAEPARIAHDRGWALEIRILFFEDDDVFFFPRSRAGVRQGFRLDKRQKQ